MTSARAIRSTSAVSGAAKDAVIVVSVRTASMTANKSLEVVGMCSSGSCDLEDGLAVPGGAGVDSGGTGADESGTETGCSPLGRSSA